jgi:hypothetical protein
MRLWLDVLLCAFVGHDDELCYPYFVCKRCYSVVRVPR